MEHLKNLGFISITKRRNQVIIQVALETGHMDQVYSYTRIKPRRESQSLLQEVLSPYCNRMDEIGSYATAQLKRLSENKKVEHCTGDLEELKDVLQACEYLLENQRESYIRDVSIRILGDSKRLETIRSKKRSFLCRDPSVYVRE